MNGDDRSAWRATATDLERELLRSARDDFEAPAGEEDRTWAALNARLAAGGAAAAPGQGLGRGFKWGMVLVSCLAVVLATAPRWLGNAPAPAPRGSQPLRVAPRAANREGAAAPVEVPAVSPAAALPLAVEPQPSRSGAAVATKPKPPSAVSAVAAPPSAAPAAESAPEVASRLREESALISLARGQLRAGHPQTALSTLEQARRKFPSGVLAQEREALTIEALSKSGQNDEARAREIEFAREHPESPHTGRLERVVP